MYKDKNKRRLATKERVKRFRQKQKGVTEGVTGVTSEGICPACGGKGYREFEAGLIRMPCRECR